MKILLIGATGQIGYSLTRALAKTEHDLTLLVRDRNKLPFPDAVRILEAASFTPEVFQHALEDIEHVIYGVGLPEQYQRDPGIFERINLGLLRQFLEVLVEMGPKRLTYLSTYEVFAAREGIIRESEDLASEEGLTPYFLAMHKAYTHALQVARQHDLKMTTIHPAALYGGLDTGDGFTHYIENLLRGRRDRLPFIFPGKFPLVHADNLAEGIIKSLDHSGPFIFSDGMSSLQEIASTLKRLTGSFVPPTVPASLARTGVGLVEPLARLLHLKPIMARVQVEFITKGYEPKADKAIRDLGWQPLPLEEGLRRYLGTRK